MPNLNWSLLGGVKGEDLDMAKSTCAVVHRKLPLQLHVSGCEYLPVVKFVVHGIVLKVNCWKSISTSRRMILQFKLTWCL